MCVVLRWRFSSFLPLAILFAYQTAIYYANNFKERSPYVFFCLPLNRYIGLALHGLVKWLKSYIFWVLKIYCWAAAALLLFFFIKVEFLLLLWFKLFYCCTYTIANLKCFRKQFLNFFENSFYFQYLYLEKSDIKIIIDLENGLESTFQLFLRYIHKLKIGY